MGRVQEVEPGPSGDIARGLSPGRAFLVVAALVVAAAVAAWLARPDDPPPAPSGTTSAGGTLTDEQALARFHELWELDRTARLSRDPSYVSVIYTADSRSGRGAYNALAAALRDGVIDRSHDRLLKVGVVANGADGVELQVTKHHIPCIVDERGRNVLVQRPPSLLWISERWTLHFERGAWRIFEKRTIEDRLVRKVRGGCP